MLVHLPAVILFCAGVTVAASVRKEDKDASPDVQRAKNADNLLHKQLLSLRNTSYAALNLGPPVPPPPNSILHSTLVERTEPQNQNNSRSTEINKPVLTAQHRDGSGGGHMHIIQTGGNNNNNMAALLPLLLMNNNNNGGGGGRQDAGGGNNNAALTAMMMAMMNQHSSNTNQVQYYGGHSS